MTAKSQDATTKWNSLDNQPKSRSLLCPRIPNGTRIGRLSKALTVVLNVHFCTRVKKAIARVNNQFGGII
jgi:hypothetical protein